MHSVEASPHASLAQPPTRTKPSAEPNTKEATRIASLYDKRNGNSSFTAGLEKKRALTKLAVDAPLVKPRAPRATRDPSGSGSS